MVLDAKYSSKVRPLSKMSHLSKIQGLQVLSVYCVMFVLSACSIIYEMLIAHSVSFFGGHTVQWYSLAIGLYLVAMGLGTLFVRGGKSREELLTTLFCIEVFLSCLGASAAFAIDFSHLISTFAILKEVNVCFILPFIPTVVSVILLIGLLTGMELPLLLSLSDRIVLGDIASSDLPKEEVSNRHIRHTVLASDYVGSLIGGILFPLLLLPYLNSFSIGLIVALINLIVAYVLVSGQFGSMQWGVARRIVCLLAMSVCLIGLFYKSNIEQYFLQRRYYLNTLSSSLSEFLFNKANVPNVERYQSAYQRIDIVKLNSADYSDILIDAYSKKFIRHTQYPRDYALYINGNPQLYSNYDEVYHEYFAHMPILHMAKIPDNVLILGGGDGLLLRELIKYPSIKKIVIVDIDPVMIKLAHNHPVLRAMNADAFSDKRVTVIVDDAYHFVRELSLREGEVDNNDSKFGDLKFDGIYLDFPYPDDFDVSRLYSREFYSMLRKCLGVDGVMTMNAAGIQELGFPDENGRQEIFENNHWNTYWATLRSGGFKHIVPFLSNFEVDNSKALEMLLKSDFSPYREDVPTDDIIKKAEDFIRMNSQVLQYGFILAHDADLSSARKIDLPNIELNVLTPKRYANAFMTPFIAPDKLDEDAISSIMKPNLVSGSILQIKVPMVMSQ